MAQPFYARKIDLNIGPRKGELFTVLKLIIMVQSLPSRWLPRSHKSRP